MIVETVLPIIISVISIIVSAVCAVITFFQNKKINNINMRADYYHIIFDEYLIKRIPESHRYLRFDNNHLVDSETIDETLSDLLKDIVYFKFNDNGFYMELKKSIEEIEDFILQCGNKTYVQEEQGKVFESIAKRIEDLYALINNSFIGK